MRDNIFSTMYFKASRQYRNLDSYCKKARKENEEINLKILRKISIITAVIIFAFIMITPILIPGWKITKHYTIFFICMVTFALIMQLIYENMHKSKSKNVIKICCAVFLLVIMSFLIVIDTVPYPKSAQSFVAIFMVAAPVLFVIPLYEMLFFQLFLLIGFISMALIYKENMMARGDIFNVLFGFVLSIVIYFIVMNIRMHDYFQRDKYKLSSELDSLTGISNRSTCKNRIERYLSIRELDEYCAMMILDVDDFKQVNDKLGHANGDKVLQEVAAVLSDVFRGSDIVGRFGGDEFICFIKEIYDEQILQRKCEEINTKIRTVLDGKFNIGVSMGFCVLYHEEASLEEMFRVADEALYEAKTFGKGTYVIHEFKRKNIADDKLPLMIIIDDNLVDRETLSVQFDGEYRIEKFEDGAEAYEYIVKNASEISVVLLDMIMPGLNGFDLLKQMKSKPEIAWIPVIAVSSDEETEEQALKYGAEDMIVKPIVPTIAKLRVAKVMKKK